MKADVLSQSNLKISKVSRAFGSFCQILLIVSLLDHLYWAKSRDLESILNQRIVANMFYTTKSKQAVKSLSNPASVQQFRQVHPASLWDSTSNLRGRVDLLILPDSDPSISSKCSDLHQK